MSDDIAFAPDGTMAWTAFLTGDLYSRKGDGAVKKLASGLPGINSLAFRKDRGCTRRKFSRRRAL